MVSDKLGRPAIKPPRPKEDVTIPASPSLEEAAKDSGNEGDMKTVTKLLENLIEQQQRLARRLDATVGAPAREPTRPERVLVREKKAPTTFAIGRDGERLARRHDNTSDPFELPPEFIEMARADGFSLEWKAASVHGKDRTRYIAKLQANGWRSVPSNRLPGMYAPEGDNGVVTYEGMILMERPLALTEEARREDAHKAREQVQMKHDSWGVSSKNTEIFDPNTHNARSHTIAPRSSIEATDPNWQPRLEIAQEDV